MMDASAAAPFPYFNPRLIAQSFVRVADEHVIQAPENLECEWYHSPYDTDLIVWRDTRGIFVRLHFCFSGLTLDWDLMNGTQSGYILEGPSDELSHSIFGEIAYDPNLSEETRNAVLEIVKEMRVIHDVDRTRIVEYFCKSLTYSKISQTAGKESFLWSEFRTLLKKFFG